METVQCGSTRIVVWVNPNDSTNNYYGVTGDPFKGNRVQNLVINFAAGETFLSGKRCTMLQLGSINRQPSHGVRPTFWEGKPH